MVKWGNCHPPFMNTPHQMTSLTKEQVRQLTPEQQELLGSLEAARIRRQQQLLTQARGYRGKLIVPVLAMMILLGLFYGGAHLIVLVVTSLLVVWMVIQFHVNGLNRRLDALLELLETDGKL